jgi:hypothetical protein
VDGAGVAAGEATVAAAGLADGGRIRVIPA